MVGSISRHLAFLFFSELHKKIKRRTKNRNRKGKNFNDLFHSSVATCEQVQYCLKHFFCPLFLWILATVYGLLPQQQLPPAPVPGSGCSSNSSSNSSTRISPRLKTLIKYLEGLMWLFFACTATTAATTTTTTTTSTAAASSS